MTPNNGLQKLEEVINQALDFFGEGKFEETKKVLLENINLFSEEAQVKILSAIIAAELHKQFQQIENLLYLKKILEELQDK